MRPLRWCVARVAVLQISIGIAAGCSGLKAKDSAEVKTVHFPMAITGSHFIMHEGQKVTLALVDQQTGEKVFSDSTTVKNGTFSFSSDDALSDGRAYFVDFYVDQNGNGTCDAPPVDHVWRQAVDAVHGKVTRDLAHQMNFYDACPSLNGSGDAARSADLATVSGRLKLSENVTDAPTLNPGQTLAGATVFLEGSPSQIAKTDAAGAFTLKISLEAETALADGGRRLVMWYTVPAAEREDGDWALASSRFGAIKGIPSVAGSGTTLAMGDVGLGYTASALLSVVSKSTNRGASQCWFAVPALGFALFFSDQGQGVYKLDYLPPETYAATVTCPGHHSVPMDLVIPALTQRGTTIEIPTIYVD